MFNIGPWELGLILLVALIVVGPGKLPEVAKAIGKGINEFKKVTNDYKREFQEAMADLEQQASLEGKTGDNKSTPPAAPLGNSIEEIAQKFDSEMGAEGHDESTVAATGQSHPAS